MQATADEVLGLAEAQGFALRGVASVAGSSHEAAVRGWIERGEHGEMGYLAEHLEIRLDPGRLLRGAASVVAVGDAYASKGLRGQGAEGQSEDSQEAAAAWHSAPVSLGPPAPAPKGRVARYAWGDDYHKVLKKRLHRLADTLAERYPGERFRSTVDTAPALEREHAARAGLGWQAKNTMLIHPRHGSWFVLGLVFSTLRVEGLKGQGVEAQSEMPQAVPEASHSAPLPLSPLAPGSTPCANCTRCIDACPTDAIATRGYALDARRCVSYLTLEHRSVIPAQLHAGMGDWLAGCDICQEVCPYNRVGERHPLPVHPRYAPSPRRLDEGLDLAEVIGWTSEDRATRFRGSALKRMKLNMVRRNALIAAGNVLAERDDDRLREAVRGCLDDADELVRQTARQVWERVGATGG
jgi:epoxyqueuosine reductase